MAKFFAGPGRGCIGNRQNDQDRLQFPEIHEACIIFGRFAYILDTAKERRWSAVRMMPILEP
jgi:hypothetical protein